MGIGGHGFPYFITSFLVFQLRASAVTVTFTQFCFPCVYLFHSQSFLRGETTRICEDLLARLPLEYCVSDTEYDELVELQDSIYLLPGLSGMKENPSYTIVDYSATQILFPSRLDCTFRER